MRECFCNNARIKVYGWKLKYTWIIINLQSLLSILDSPILFFQYSSQIFPPCDLKKNTQPPVIHRKILWLLSFPRKITIPRLLKRILLRKRCTSFPSSFFSPHLFRIVASLTFPYSPSPLTPFLIIFLSYLQHFSSKCRVRAAKLFSFPPSPETLSKLGANFSLSRDGSSTGNALEQSNEEYNLSLSCKVSL